MCRKKYDIPKSLLTDEKLSKRIYDGTMVPLQIINLWIYYLKKYVYIFSTGIDIFYRDRVTNSEFGDISYKCRYI